MPNPYRKGTRAWYRYERRRYQQQEVTMHTIMWGGLSIFFIALYWIIAAN